MTKGDFFYVQTDMVDDEKIRIIESMPEGDTIIVLWLKLMTLARKCNSDGWVWLAEGKPYSDDHLAAIWRRPLNTVKLALQLFEDMSMVHRNGQGIYLTNWVEYQNVDALANIREANKQRVRRFRERQKLLSPPNDVTLQCNVTVMPDKDKDNDNDKDRVCQRTPKNSNNKYISELQKYLGFPERVAVDPIPNPAKEARFIDKMIRRGFTWPQIFDTWRAKVDDRGEFVSMVYVNEDIGKKGGNHGAHSRNPRRVPKHYEYKQPNEYQ